MFSRTLHRAQYFWGKRRLLYDMCCSSLSVSRSDSSGHKREIPVSEVFGVPQTTFSDILSSPAAQTSTRHPGFQLSTVEMVKSLPNDEEAAFPVREDIPVREDTIRLKSTVLSTVRDILIKPEDITIDTVIGSGGFGKVYLGSYKGTKVAVKQIPLHSNNHNEVLMEIVHAARVRHPNTVGLIGASLQGTKFRMVMAFAENGSLADALADHWSNWRPVNSRYPHTKNEKFSEFPEVTAAALKENKKQLMAFVKFVHEADSCVLDLPLKATRAGVCFADILWMMRSIALGLDYLHSLEMPIVHYDLKPQNILISVDGEPMISDFGLARSVQDITVRAGKQGSCKYMAPEVILDGLDGDVSAESQFAFKVDVYAFGLIAWQLIKGKAHVDRMDFEAAVRQAQEGDRQPEPSTRDGKGAADSETKPKSAATLSEEGGDGEGVHREEGSGDRQMSSLADDALPADAPLAGVQIIYLRDQGGYRLVLPVETPKWLADMVNTCWSKQPQVRPSFRELIEILDIHAPLGNSADGFGSFMEVGRGWRIVPIGPTYIMPMPS